MTDSDIEQNSQPIIPRDVFTSLPDGESVRKDDLRIQACGSVDELNSYIGLLLTDVPINLVSELQTIQTNLFSVGAIVAGRAMKEGWPTTDDVDSLKSRITDFNQQCGAISSFILPGGCHAAALAHICRTICRRAEREIVATEKYEVVPYMNRLSTYFFHLARYLNLFYGYKEFYI